MSEEKKITKEELLKPFNMVSLYARGAFPMADEDNNINWYMPRTRAIIPLLNYNIPRSLKKFLKTADFEYRYDSAVTDVIDRCADRDQTWISEELKNAYKNLVKIGHLHTVEVYQKNSLVGGLYGVTYKGAFFGESMFSDVEQASKAALVKLLEHLSEKGFVLLDVQFMTDHLKMFGATEISFEDFTDLLIEAYQVNIYFT